MDEARVRQIERRAQRLEQARARSDDAIDLMLGETLDLVREVIRLRSAIQTHREAYGGPELAGPHELSAANRRLWATIESKPTA